MAFRPSNRRELHPAVSIFSWLLFAVAVEFAAPLRLPWLALLSLPLLIPMEARRKFARLLWGTRWLWLSLFLLHAWTVPGVLVFPYDWSPTQEGVQAGLLRVARLLLLLAALSRLLVEFAPRQLAAGVYLLCAPLGWLGLDRRALAVRLALTFELMEALPRKTDWRQVLKSPLAEPAGAAQEEMHLSVPAAHAPDGVILLSAMLLLGVAAV